MYTIQNWVAELAFAICSLRNTEQASCLLKTSFSSSIKSVMMVQGWVVSTQILQEIFFF